jgi:hypothetical protein
MSNYRNYILRSDSTLALAVDQLSSPVSRLLLLLLHTKSYPRSGLSRLGRSITAFRLEYEAIAHPALPSKQYKVLHDIRTFLWIAHAAQQLLFAEKIPTLSLALVLYKHMVVLFKTIEPIMRSRIVHAARSHTRHKAKSVEPCAVRRPTGQCSRYARPTQAPSMEPDVEYTMRRPTGALNAVVSMFYKGEHGLMKCTHQPVSPTLSSIYSQLRILQVLLSCAPLSPSLPPSSSSSLQSLPTSVSLHGVV